MPHLCETCGHEFSQKQGLRKHKARKNPCKKNTTLEILVQAEVAKALVSAGVLPQVPSPITSAIVTKPFLKWVGGKTQIIDDVLAHFPQTFVNYYEPFLGGGSVLLALLSHIKSGKIHITGRIYASDLNSNIINLFKTIQSNPDAFIIETKALIAEFTPLKGTVINRKPVTLDEAKTSQESYYYWTRSCFNALKGADRNTPKAAAMCLFLNKTNFRGVYRDGPSGFNVPFGHNKNPSIMDETHIRAVSALIQPVEFSCYSYVEPLDRAASDDFVYIDPPYAPENEKSFVGYTTDGFDLANHQRLFKACATMTAKHVKFLMSNADVKLVRDAFPAQIYKTKTIVCRRAIHSKKPETKTNEVLITN
jgi:DNA adenine methylase